ncbi:hypothetical protein ABZ348_29600, partial [Streptomyces sp. NPDC005963]
ITPENEPHTLTHDAHNPNPTTAFALSRLAHPDLHPSPTFGGETPTPIGVFRNTQRPVYDTLMNNQLDTATEQLGKGDLTALLTGNDAWTVRPQRSAATPLPV